MGREETVNPEDLFTEPPRNLERLSPVETTTEDKFVGIVVPDWQGIVGIVEKYGARIRGVDGQGIYTKGSNQYPNILLEVIQRRIAEEGHFPTMLDGPGNNPLKVRLMKDSQGRPTRQYLVAVLHYIDSKPAHNVVEKDIAQEMGFQRALSSTIIDLKFGTVDSWWYNIDLFKLLEPLKVTRQQAERQVASLVAQIGGGSSFYYQYGDINIPGELLLGYITRMVDSGGRYVASSGSRIIIPAWNVNRKPGEQITVEPLSIRISLGSEMGMIDYKMLAIPEVLRGARDELRQKIVKTQSTD